MKVFVIIPAAGLGTRMAPAGKKTAAKQFLELNGTPILLHTLRVFARNRQTAQIVVALRMRYEEALQMQARDPNRWEVLDRPFLANYGKPVNKGYVRYTALAGLLGLMIGTGLAIHRANRIQPQPNLV